MTLVGLVMDAGERTEEVCVRDTRLDGRQHVVFDDRPSKVQATIQDIMPRRIGAYIWKITSDLQLEDIAKVKLEDGNLLT